MTARKGLVPYSRPLLEMVPRSQPFVYNGPDHLALPSPIPAQHPPALEQLLLQLLKEKKTRIRVRLCTPTRDPRTRLPQTPLILSRERKTLPGSLGQQKRSSQNHRPWTIDLSSGRSHSRTRRFTRGTALPLRSQVRPRAKGSAPGTRGPIAARRKAPDLYKRVTRFYGSFEGSFSRKSL